MTLCLNNQGINIEKVNIHDNHIISCNFDHRGTDGHSKLYTE